MSRKVCKFPGCEREVHGLGLCNAHHLQQNRGKPLTPLMPARGTQSIEERFWGNVQKGDGCWVWAGNVRMPQGYGRLVVGRKHLYAHRIAWELATGRPIPEGMVIDHICRNRLCVRKSHLRVTTNQLNVEYRPRGRTPQPTSGIRGVYANHSKWMARVVHSGTTYNLGQYADKTEAGQVAAAKRKELFRFPEYLGDLA